LQNTIIKLGAQDCHFAEKGAYTGDISAAMLKDIGIKNVILGHSERRLFHKETDLEICNKVKAAHQSGLNVILCIGETKEEKDKGLTLSVLKNQIDNSLNCDFNAENTVIAYEPVWAIGTSLTPTIEEIQSTHLAIRKHIDSKNQNTANNIKILYGGSLKASNAKDILSLTDVDGGLIGGASLIASEFLSIINS
jgi:triosephosphate isomerase